MMGSGHWRMMRMGVEDPKQMKPSKGVWRRVARFARPYLGRILAYLGTILAMAVMSKVQPLLLKLLLDRAFTKTATDKAGALRIVNLVGVVSVALIAGSTLFQLANRYLGSKIGESVIFDLRTKLYDHVQRMPVAFFTRTQTGALISRLNSDVVGAQSALTSTLGGVISDAINLTVVLVIMLSLNWQLTALALVVLPLFVLPSKKVGKKVQVLVREQMNNNSAMNQQMTERFNVAGAILVKLFGKAAREQAEFSDRAGRVRDIGVRLALYMSGFFLALTAVSSVGNAIIYWYGGHLVINSGISAGTLVALAAYVAQMYGPLQSLTSARVNIMSTFVSFDRVFEVLDMPQMITQREGASELESPRGRVEFDHVSFAYPPSEQVTIESLRDPASAIPSGRGMKAPARAGLLPSDGRSPPPEPPPAEVLHDVSFVIEPGQMVALVGPSGAGKSTIAALVPRLYDVTAGAVRFDGTDVRDLTLESLTAAVGVVTQDPHMFHDSIRNNLLYARPQAGEEELVQACKAANIWDLIASLPEGLDTTVGERGYRLSGGEKQRLAIARVLLKDPALIILDEATAHLDSESEALIQRALTLALSKRSSLVIAHRLSTIVAADQILVVDAGRIVERGRHLELVGLGGLYSELYRTQFLRSGV